MVTIPTQEPKRFRAGDTLTFKRYFSEYDPATYTLNYVLNSSTKMFTFACTDNGDGYHLATVAASVTALWNEDEYKWQAYMVEGANRYTVGNGVMKVLPDLTTGAIDDRSHVKKTLDALEATVEGRATNDQLSYSINGRSLQKTPIEELIKLHNRYTYLYNRELQAEEINNGRGKRNKIQIRFNN